MGEEGKNVLKDILNEALITTEITLDWIAGIILPLHKKGDKRERKNYRGRLFREFRRRE